MRDPMWMVIALVAAFAAKRLHLPSLLDGVLSLPKQIGGIHRDGGTFLIEYGSVDLYMD